MIFVIDTDTANIPSVCGRSVMLPVIGATHESSVYVLDGRAIGESDISIMRSKKNDGTWVILPGSMPGKTNVTAEIIDQYPR